MAVTVCAEPGCPELVNGGRCPRHRRTRRRGPLPYDTAQWQHRRATYRARHPRCACGCGRASTDVDHIIPRRILVAAGIHDPDHDRWLCALAHSCHSQKTQTVDRPLLAALTAGAEPDDLAEQALSAFDAWLEARNP